MTTITPNPAAIPNREAAATNRLSRAASAIWRLRTADPDPMGDPSGDCGDLIAAAERRHVLKVIADAGYATPGEYNADLRARMCNPPGQGGRTMSLRVHDLLCILEAGDVCPDCGAALDVTSHRTRQYGGGWDTVERCPDCGYAQVYV